MSETRTNRNCEARQSPRHLVWTSGARTHIRFKKIYMNCSYNYGIKTVGHGSHLCLTDVNEHKTLRKSHGATPAWVPVHHCSCNGVYGHWSSFSYQRQGR